MKKSDEGDNTENQKPQQKGIPQSLLNIINENCGGCYLLCLVDENGCLQTAFSSDNEAYNYVLTQGAINVAKALKRACEVDSQISYQNICAQIGVNPFPPEMSFLLGGDVDEEEGYVDSDEEDDDLEKS